MAGKSMAFAGSWYPASAKECETSITGFLKEKNGPHPGSFIGGIVPHAGWYFSGSIACRVIASLGPFDPVDTVLVFGGHMHPESRPILLYQSSEQAFVHTPFGDIQVDQDLAQALVETGRITGVSPDRFPDENTLELQLPFIKYFFPDAKIIMACVPPSKTGIAIGIEATEQAAQMSKTIRIIGSTDMTHYGPNFNFTPAGTGETAVEWVRNENDKQAVEALLAMDENKIVDQGLKNQNMCCSGAAAATAAACKKNGAVSAVELDYATSFEKSKDTSFVGYSGILYSAS